MLRVWILVICMIAMSGFATAKEPDSVATREATFSMYCYWTGEATLGRLPGVLQSQIGHRAGSEIVCVEYDPRLTDLQQMVAALRKQSSFYSVVVDDEASRGNLQQEIGETEIRVAPEKAHFIEPKHSLRTRHPDLYYLPLTEKEAIALNSWAYFGGPMPIALDEHQKALRRQIRTRLKSKSADDLHPRRSERELEKYAAELMRWLGN